MERDYEREAFGVRLSGRRPSWRRRYRMVRPRGQGRETLSDGWTRGRKSHARRRQELRDSHARLATGACLRPSVPSRARRR